MSLTAFHAEDREALQGDLTAQLLRDWNCKLLAGDARAICDLQNTVLDKLSEDDGKAIFVQAALGRGGEAFARLVAQVMFDQCEADAGRSVEFIEQRRRQERDESRISQAMADRAAA
jgi:hypothetical protein